jgi:hypothetical protein
VHRTPMPPETFNIAGLGSVFPNPPPPCQEQLNHPAHLHLHRPPTCTGCKCRWVQCRFLSSLLSPFSFLLFFIPPSIEI